MIKITGAWFINWRGEVHGPDGHGGVEVKKCGKVLARDENDIIWQHKENEFRNPRQFVEAVNKRGTIDPAHWERKSDDSEAAAYYRNMLEGDELR